MRKLILSGVALLALACSKDVEQGGDTQVKTTATYSQVGQAHNDGLDAVMPKMIQAINSGATDAQVISRLYTEANSFIQGDPVTSQNIAAAQTGIQDIKGQEATFLGFGNDRSKDFQWIDTEYGQVGASHALISYVKDLYDAMAETDDTKRAAKISGIEANAQGSLTAAEYDALMYTSAVAQYSYQFWSDNLKAYGKAVGMSFSFKAQARDWNWFTNSLEKMGKADLVGAGYGLLTGGPPGAVGAGMTSSGLRGIAILIWE